MLPSDVSLLHDKAFRQYVELYARDEPESDNIARMVQNAGKIDKKNTKFKVRSHLLGEGHDIYGNSDTERGNTERGPTVSKTSPN